MSETLRNDRAPEGRALVLMYHAIPHESAARGQFGADPHYSVGLRQFRSQLDLMLRRGKRPACVRDLLRQKPADRGLAAVALTFDDGHESNFEAFGEIAARGGSADLFVNPSTVGTPGYLSWTQLRELSRAGASVQSHGQHHVFLDELPPASVRRELETSRRRIADEIGQAPELFAPPNGRLPAGGVELALEVGYSAVCSSKVGLWHAGTGPEIPRVAVLSSTTESQLRGWIRQDRLTVWTALARASVLSSGKRVLGNRGYVRLRQQLLRLRGQGRA